MTRQEAKAVLYEWQESMVKHGVPLDTSKVQALRVAIEALSERPHGKWVFSTSIPIGGGRESAGYKCSACGGNFFRVDGMNFCPNCGAVMTRHADPWRSESEKEYVENTIREASSGKD